MCVDGMIEGDDGYEQSRYYLTDVGLCSYPCLVRKAVEILDDAPKAQTRRDRGAGLLRLAGLL